VLGGGGQSPREEPYKFEGIKRCEQAKDSDGKIVNHGKYMEWYGNDKIAITGEYKMGKKTGRWIEYGRGGEKTSDKYFEDGKEVPRP